MTHDPPSATATTRASAPAPAPLPLRRHLVAAVALYVPTLLLLAALHAVARRLGVPFSALTRDPAAAVGAEFYAGCLSHLGALLWCVGAGVCVFTYAVTRHAAEAPWRRFFIAWGTLTTLLMADDLFMLHDGLVPVTLGKGEKLFFVAYAFAALGCLALSVRVIRRTPYGYLLAAAGFLVCSLALDAGVVGWPEENRHVFEDGSKLLGALSWCGYLVGTCFVQLRRLLPRPTGAADLPGLTDGYPRDACATAAATTRAAGAGGP